ncbi:MAG: hypothetical protein AAGJ52_07235 [Pseudomonadota bacterium]
MRYAFALIVGLMMLSTSVEARTAPDLELVVDPDLPQSESEWRPWIDRAVAAVASIGGGFPVPEVKVVLHASTGSKPVGFGWIRRNSPPEVHLQVSRDASTDDLLDDWHAYHEFAHLLLPFSGNRDIWFAEGLASYYQYFLQARAGVIDPDEAWRRLIAGFQRGFDDPAGEGERLARLSPQMWRMQAFRRVYWSGAAFFLRVDHRLRAATDHEQSLDSTLAAFATCCMRDGSERWSAQSLVRQLGELSVPEIWQEEYARVMQSMAYPDFGGAAQAFGLAADERQVRLLEDERGQQRRRALAMGRPYN